MSQVRYLFTLDKSENTRLTASLLADAVFGDDAEVELRDLTGAGCFHEIHSLAAEKIFIYANGSGDKFGGYSASEFARVFNQRFLENFKETDKNGLQHIYLIGCDMGRITADDGGTSVSQGISDELDKLGFRKIIVHGIAKPEHAMDDVLYLNVLHCSGGKGLLTAASALAHGGGPADMQTGYLKAYLLPGDDSAKISELETDKHKNRGAIIDIIREKSFLLINHANPEQELNKPQNIFYPRETRANRKLRVLRDTTRQCGGDHAKACELLAHHRADLQAAQSPVMTAIDFLIDRVHEASDDSWHYVVSEAFRYFKQHAKYKEFFNAKNETTLLLDALAANNIKQANKVLGVKAVKDQNQKRFMLFRKKETPGIALRSAMVEAPQPLFMSTPLMPAGLTGKVAQLAQDLRSEIASLKQGCFACFFFGKIRTKQAKLAVVESLRSCNTLVDAKEVARRALADSCVIGGWWHSRTNDLLKEIQYYQPDGAATNMQARRM